MAIVASHYKELLRISTGRNEASWGSAISTSFHSSGRPSTVLTDDPVDFLDVGMVISSRFYLSWQMKVFCSAAVRDAKMFFAAGVLPELGAYCRIGPTRIFCRTD